MVELTLVRHASTLLNEQGRFQGWLDPDLSPAGEAHARRLRTLVARSGRPEHVWSSDLRRAWRTAALAVPGVPVERDARLRELAFGAFDGATWDENASRHGKAFQRWARDPERYPPPGGERLESLRLRVAGWLDDLPAAGRVLVVCHGGPLRVLLARCLALPARWEIERGLVLQPGAVARTAWGKP